jgi:hypothetical protein
MAKRPPSAQLPDPVVWIGILISLSLFVAGALKWVKESRRPEAVCGDYKDSPQTFGYCLYQQVHLMETADEAIRLCERAADWSSACRVAWVADRMVREPQTDMGLMLAVCGQDPDCRLDVLDASASADVVEQLDRCAEDALANGADCAGHALERWWLAYPDREEVGRLAAQSEVFPEVVGRFLAAAAVCSDTRPCPKAGPNRNNCEAWSQYLSQHPESCPSRSAFAAQGEG